MIYNEKIQEMLNNALETVGGATYMGEDITFYVHNGVGEFRAKTARTQRKKGKFIINCILNYGASTPIAVAGLNAFEMRQTLDIIVPTDLTCKDAESDIYTGGINYALAVVEQFTRDAIGDTGTLDFGEDEEYGYVLSVGKPFEGQEGTFAGIGRAIPLSIDLSWQIFNGVLGNNLELYVASHGSQNYTKAVVIDGTATRTKTGETNQYSQTDVEPTVYEEMKTTITQQGLKLQLQIPFTKSGVGAKLVGDLWKSDLNKIYDLKLYDSVNYIHTDDETDNPLKLEMLTEEINLPMTAGAFLAVTVKFVIAKV